MNSGLIPYQVKIAIKVALINFKDLLSGKYLKFARKRNHQYQLKYSSQISQDLRSNEAKLHNLFIAKNAIEEITVLPNEIFSFWKTVGAPSLKNGFKESRSIEGNTITQTIGGGLCQISGLIYYVSLLAGLQILERHNHSIDIYNDKTRFAPLGSDATLVYGYKDLRIVNNLDTPIKFQFKFENDKLTIILISERRLQKKKIRFISVDRQQNQVEIETYADNKIIDTSIYKRLEN